MKFVVLFAIKWYMLMDKVQYLNKMQDIISDSSKCKLLGSTCKLNYIKKTEKKIINLLKELAKNAIGYKLHIFKNKIKLMTESIYSPITTRIIFVSKPVLKIELKDPIPFIEKSCVVYR